MKKNIQARTSILICCVIALGFVITTAVNLISNRGAFHTDIEHVSNLTSEGIYYQIDTIFTKPVNISLTMANDSLLKEFLNQEAGHMDETDFLEGMRRYLMAYREKYSYDSVFLVSAKTGRYYHFNGVDRQLKPEDPENDWYYAFLESDSEYSLNIDNDEAADNEITVFINCRIRDEEGNTMGVVGVGFRVDYLQELLKEYEERFNVEAYLLNPSGLIEVSTDKTGFKAEGLFDNCGYPELKEDILGNREEVQTFWYGNYGDSGYLVTQYIPNLEWFLLIDYSSTAMEQRLSRQVVAGLLVTLAATAAILFIVSGIIRKYNQKITELAVKRERTHQNIFQKETEKLYENIYELDITHNRPASEATEEYFESLGAPRNTPYDKALEIVAEKQIKEEYRRGYVETFCPENVLKAFDNGQESLQYDFMLTSDGLSYYWMRITARIFRWEEDRSIRMFTYRQNITEEKLREQDMLGKMEMDSLTGLYNKAAAQNSIRKRLAQCPDGQYAFFILDIDNFKMINDTFGHSAGDDVLLQFARNLKAQFAPEDIVGRIGGDEFVVFSAIPSLKWLGEKAVELNGQLQYSFVMENKSARISASIGIAVSPRDGAEFELLYKNADSALYETKKKGKNGYTVYGKQLLK